MKESWIDIVLKIEAEARGSGIAVFHGGGGSVSEEPVGENDEERSGDSDLDLPPWRNQEIQ